MTAPSVKMLYVDLDDCMYKNDWKVADMITVNMKEYVKRFNFEDGEAYKLYKKYGTTLRGLQQEGYDLDVEDFLTACHNLPDAKEFIHDDPDLQAMLRRVTVDKYCLTASPVEHATRCMDLLGVSDCFQHPTIDVRAVEFFTKHNPECYAKAMQIAGVTDPSSCMLLDDSTSNMKAAKAAGWQTVLVGKTSRDDGSELVCPEADYIVDTIMEVEALLPQLFDSAAAAGEN